MEIYISVLEEEARQDEREPNLKAVGDRDEGMWREYEHACITAQQCLAEHQNMSDIRNGLSIDDTQQPRAQPIDNSAAAPNTPGGTIQRSTWTSLLLETKEATWTLN